MKYLKTYEDNELLFKKYFVYTISNQNGKKLSIWEYIKTNNQLNYLVVKKHYTVTEKGVFDDVYVRDDIDFELYASIKSNIIYETNDLKEAIDMAKSYFVSKKYNI